MPEFNYDLVLESLYTTIKEGYQNKSIDAEHLLYLADLITELVNRTKEEGSGE